MNIKYLTGALSLAFFTMGGSVQASDEGPTFDKIRSTGEISLGYRETAIPFAYLDDKHEPTGFSVDLCHEIVDILKEEKGLPDLKVIYQPVTASNRIPLLVNGSIDIECGSTTDTEERRKAVSFLYTTYLTGTKILTRVDSGFKELEDLKGKKIQMTMGTNNIKAVQQVSREQNLDLEIVYGQDHAENFLQLKNGRVDGISTDDILLSGLRAESDAPQDYTFVGPFLSTEHYALMVRKDDPQFKDFANNALKTLFDNGKFNEVYDKWFVNPIPPKGIAFDIPLTDEMKVLIKNPSDTIE